MITVQNYNEKKSNINWKALPEAVTKNRDAVEGMFDLYGEDDDIDKMINTYLAKINDGQVVKAADKNLNDKKPKNLSEFKRYLKNNIGKTLYMRSSYPRRVGVEERNEEREIAKVQSDSVMFNREGGSGESWLQFGKASNWTFTGIMAYFREGSTQLFYLYNKPSDWKPGVTMKPDVAPKKKSGGSIHVVRPASQAETIADVVKDSKLFKIYAPKPQQRIVLQSDEHIDTIKKLEKELAAIPKKEQGGKIMDQKVYAHYFYAGSDWYVMDRSRGDREPFGYAILNGDLQLAEAGYLPLAEFQSSKQVELDFFFDQGQTLKSILKKQYPGEFEEEVKKSAPKKKAAPAKKKVKKAVDVKTVDSYSEEFKLLRRFLNSTKKEKLTFRQVHLLWMAFNKAAVSRKVRKSSDKADEFTAAQKGIEKMFGQVEFSERAKENGVKLNIENKKLIEDLQKYVSSTKINYAVTLLRSFIGFQGTQPGVDKAKRLLKKIDNAFAKDRVDSSNRLYDELMEAKAELRDYIKTPANEVEVDLIGLSAPRDLCTNRIKCEGLNSKGQLNNGYKFLKGGAVVKSKKKRQVAKPKKKAVKKRGLKKPAFVAQREQEFVEPIQPEPVPVNNQIIEPIQEPELVEVQPAPKPQTKAPVPKKRSIGRGKNLSEAMANSSENEVFTTGGNIGRFLGQLEKKPVHSVVTTLDAEQGAGKTRFFFQIINEVASTGASVLFYSLEEHPQSKLFKDKIAQYIDPSNYDRITVIDEVEDWNKETATVNSHDHIFIDSFQKLPPLDLDKDIRKAFNRKFFYLIYQQTGTKGMRGGSKAAFDGDIILKIEKGEDYRNNYVYANKNRYNDAPDLKYNIFSKELEGDLPEETPVEFTRAPNINPTSGKLIAVPL